MYHYLKSRFSNDIVMHIVSFVLPSHEDVRAIHRNVMHELIRRSVLKELRLLFI